MSSEVKACGVLEAHIAKYRAYMGGSETLSYSPTSSRLGVKLFTDESNGSFDRTDVNAEKRVRRGELQRGGLA